MQTKTHNAPSQGEWVRIWAAPRLTCTAHCNLCTRARRSAARRVWVAPTIALVENSSACVLPCSSWWWNGRGVVHDALPVSLRGRGPIGKASQSRRATPPQHATPPSPPAPHLTALEGALHLVAHLEGRRRRAFSSLWRFNISGCALAVGARLADSGTRAPCNPPSPAGRPSSDRPPATASR